MDSSLTWNIYAVVFGALSVLALRDRAKAINALKVAVRSLTTMLPVMLVFIGFIGLLLGLVPPEAISQT